MPSALEHGRQAHAGAQLVARRRDRVAGERRERRRAQALHAAADGHEERQAADAVAHRLHRVGAALAAHGVDRRRPVAQRDVVDGELAVARRQVGARAVIEQPDVVVVLAEVLDEALGHRVERERARRVAVARREHDGTLGAHPVAGEADLGSVRGRHGVHLRLRKRRGRLRAGHGAGGLHAAPPQHGSEQVLYPPPAPEIKQRSARESAGARPGGRLWLRPCRARASDGGARAYGEATDAICDEPTLGVRATASKARRHRLAGAAAALDPVRVEADREPHGRRLRGAGQRLGRGRQGGQALPGRQQRVARGRAAEQGRRRRRDAAAVDRVDEAAAKVDNIELTTAAAAKAKGDRAAGRPGPPAARRDRLARGGAPGREGPARRARRRRGQGRRPTVRRRPAGAVGRHAGAAEGRTWRRPRPPASPSS